MHINFIIWISIKLILARQESMTKIRSVEEESRIGLGLWIIRLSQQTFVLVDYFLYNLAAEWISTPLAKT